MMRGLISVVLALGLASPAIAASGDLGDETSSRETDLPFSRALTASGIVMGSLADSLATTDAPVPALREALQALAFTLDLNRDVRTGDRFHLRYEQLFTLDGEPTAGGRLLWAEIKTARTVAAVHRFRPHGGPYDGTEQFWQPNGKAAAPPVLRAPLDPMTLTSGFGLRTDPLDQPPGPLAGLANVAAPAPPLPPKAEPTPEEKAEVKREEKAIARADAGLAFEGSLGSATDRFRNTDLDRIMAERRANARREKAEAERAAQEAEAAAAAKANAPPPVVQAPAPPPPKLFMHEGLDLLANTGTPIMAAADGTVISAGPNGGYGNWIRLKHQGRLTTVYGHLSRFAPDLAPGTVVARGDVIGFVGNTGRSTGAHLHYELLVGATPVDPRTHAATRPGQLAGADLARLAKQIAATQAERVGETATADFGLSAASHLPAGDACTAF